MVKEKDQGCETRHQTVMTREGWPGTVGANVCFRVLVSKSMVPTVPQTQKLPLKIEGSLYKYSTGQEVHSGFSITTMGTLDELFGQPNSIRDRMGTL